MAGTLIVDTVQGSGGGSYDPDDVAKTRSKAWVNFNGTGTVAIRDSFNVSSITDNGTGDYTMNFSAALPNANFCMTGEAGDATAQRCVHLYSGGSFPTTAGVQVRTRYTIDGATADALYVMLSILCTL